MKKITLCCLFVFSLLLVNQTVAQKGYQRKIEALEAQKERITQQEKEALKLEVKEINRRLKKSAITSDEADQLKKEAAKKRALNIENKLAIIDNQIALLVRNQGDVNWEDEKLFEEQMKFFEDENVVLGLKIKKSDFPKFDRKTRSNLVLGFGLHNNIIEGESLLDTPHQVLGSRYFELGYIWKTRILRNSNWLRITYGVTYLSRGLKTDNQVFIEEDLPNGRFFPDVRLENANLIYASETGELRKSKFRQDDIVFPIHLEIGSSSKRQYENYVRYSTKHKFTFGIGAYLGFNVTTVQKIDFDFSEFNPQGGVLGSNSIRLLNGKSTARDGFVGLSTYIGSGNVTWHLKYDLVPNFSDTATSLKRNNISLGLRFDL